MRGQKTLSALFVCFGIALGARSASAEVSVTMNGGRVTVTAKNATVAQILAEWAKVGQTKIVNAERVPGGPVTLELKDVPEAEALEVLLRSAGGYVLAPRRMETANASRYDRILILPQSAPSPAPRPQVATVSQPRPFTPPQARPVAPGQVAGQAADDNDDQDDRPAAAPPAQVARPPVFNTFPQAAPQPRNDPPPPPPPTSTVTAPVGVAVPGMVVPTPPPAGQPGTQQQQPR
jgi:hypothetical protein